MDLRDLTERFETLGSEINGTEPTVERARDWSSMLADLCAELASETRKLKDAFER